MKRSQMWNPPTAIVIIGQPINPVNKKNGKRKNLLSEEKGKQNRHFYFYFTSSSDGPEGFLFS